MPLFPYLEAIALGCGQGLRLGYCPFVTLLCLSFQLGVGKGKVLVCQSPTPFSQIKGTVDLESLSSSLNPFDVLFPLAPKFIVYSSPSSSPLPLKCIVYSPPGLEGLVLLAVNVDFFLFSF